MLLAGEGVVEIAWDAVDNAYIKEIVEPSEEDKIYMDYVNKDYVGKIVTPWYRVLPQKVRTFD